MATAKCRQAAYGIEEIFKLINVKGIKVTVLQSFEQYLNRHHKLKELDDEQLSKNARLIQIQKKLIDLSPETFDIVYRWIKDFSESLRILKRDLRAINNTVLEFALTEVFQHQSTALTEVFQHQMYPPLCDENKLDQLLAARFLRIANKKNTGVYASLEVLLEEPVEEIKTKCIEYLKRKLKQFPLDERQVKSILRENKTIDSHISDLESSDEGDPFIFYAASIVYQHHIHVLCAAEERLEEYVFYPSELPSERESCDHKFIGHLSENNYFSLESTEQKFQKGYESEKLIREYQAKIEELEKDLKNNQEKYLILSQEMEKSKEVNLKLSKEMEKSKEVNLKLSKEMEKSKEENLILSQEMKKIKGENLELSKEKMRYEQHVEVLQTDVRGMKSKLQTVNDKLDKVLSFLNKEYSKNVIDDEKDKEEKQTDKNKSAQVANNAQNNEDRDETSYVTTGKGKEVKLLSARKSRHSGIGEHKDKTKGARTPLQLPPVNFIEPGTWRPHSRTHPVSNKFTRTVSDKTSEMISETAE